MEYSRNIESKNNVKNHTHNDLSFNLFSSDNHFAFIYKKTERLVTALFMISSLFDDTETIKQDIRKKSTYFLSKVLSLKSRGTLLVDRDSVLTSASEVLSLTEVAYYAGLMSEMNYTVVRNEFISLLESIHSYVIKKDTSGVLLDSRFFDAEHIADHKDVEPVATPPPDIKRQDVFVPENKKTEYKKPVQESVVKKTYPHETPQTQTTVAPAVKDMYEIHSSTDLKKTNRRSLIVNIIRKKGTVMLKDISPAIKGCSDKTIQRELAVLVRKGVVKKEGERRWSTYSLV